ncbi:MAG TPA: exo-alpha-sialidase, partial [Woeseiaceae bacterium]|nr:exo-alpha-sialidase [Woeseiaceae bacterium]
MRAIVTVLMLALVSGASASASPKCEPQQAAASAHCGRTPTAVFDDEGRLWIAFEFRGRVYVSTAEDDLGVLSAPVAVNSEAEDIDVNGENRPKIAIGPSGEVYVSWTRKLPGGFNGEIRFSRSLDGGASFEPVRTVNDDGLATGHRFETLLVDSGGNVYLAWIDKRDRLAATEAGESYAGAAVYYAVSTDRGKTFTENRRVAAHSCECCRIAATEAGSGDVALFYRGIFGENIRDHAFVTVDVEGVTAPMQRATDDEWHIDACPHHGPALADAGAGAFDLAWFTNGERRKGVFYARFDAGGGELTRLSPVSTDPSAGHPTLVRVPGRLLLAWKEFTGEQTVVRLVESRDDGRSWSEPAT